MVVDASGKSGFTIEQLKEEGAPIPEESETAGILYFTRHYRLRPGMESRIAMNIRLRAAILVT